MHKIVIAAAGLCLTCTAPAGATLMDFKLSATMKSYAGNVTKSLSADVIYSTDAPIDEFYSEDDMQQALYGIVSAYVDFSGQARRAFDPSSSYAGVRDSTPDYVDPMDLVAFGLFDGPGERTILSVAFNFLNSDAFGSIQLPGIAVFQSSPFWINLAFSQGPGANDLFVSDQVTYTITQMGKDSPRITVSGQAAPPAAPVPEPTTWLMMLGGLGLVGGAMRYGRKAAVRFA